MTDPLITTTDLAAYKIGDPQTFVDTANDMVRAYCGWHIAPSITESIIVDGPTGHRYLLSLPSLHVTAITSITLIEDGRVLGSGEYDWDADGAVMIRYGYWPCYPRSVEVALTHGYSTVPNDVKSIALGIAARLTEARSTAMRRREMGPFREELAISSGGSAGGAFLSKSDKELLAPYRIPVIA